MRLLFLQVLAICSLVAGALLHRANHVVHEKRAVAKPVTSVKTRRLEAHRNLTIRIGLAQQNLNELEETLLSVSHPESAKYSQHWSPERVAEYFAPGEATVSAVKEWLIDTGFRPDRLHLSRSKGWISFRANASDAEYLLKTEIYVYTQSSGREQIGYDSYSVPKVISEHVDLIRVSVHSVRHAHDNLALLKRSNSTLRPSLLTRSAGVPNKTVTPSLDNCDQYMTPECLRVLYSIDYTPKVPELNSFGIVEFTPQAYLGCDLDMFFSHFSKSQVNTRPILVSIDGGVVQQQNQSTTLDEESDLDLEYAMTLTDPTPVTLLQTGDLFEGGTSNNWLDAVDGSYCTFEGGDDPDTDGIYPDPQPGGFNQPESCGIIAPPNVISVSYNVDEVDVTAAYAMRQCYEFAKLGLMGTTVLYASGDRGVAGNDGCLCDGEKKTRFNPSFPGTCPFVTAVGATQMNVNSTLDEPESACEENRTHSGGGFSNIFPMPSYQENAVRTYLMNHPPPYTARQYNNSGMVRAYPDVSANGANYIVARDGNFSLDDGTSASTPVVGAIVTLINDARLARGKRPVGFLNPVIYHPLFSCAFHDITTGSNPGCGTPGFVTAEGWDPVTGVGTLNMKVLLDMLLVLP